MDRDSASREDPGEADSFRNYPRLKPFINSEYRRDPNKPELAYPETHRSAVMSALRSLQQRIRQLELERAEAEANMKDLSLRATSYRESLPGSPAAPPPSSRPLSELPVRDSSKAPVDPSPGVGLLDWSNPSVLAHNEINSELLSAETRCALLEKQLSYMQRMVEAAERGRREAVQREAELQQRRSQLEAGELKAHLDKVNELEREHVRLQATQTLAQDKMRELEARLHEERHHRKLMQDRAAQLESRGETARILQEKRLDDVTPAAAGAASPTNTKRQSRRKKKVVVTGRRSGSTDPRGGREHFRLNIAKMPFVAGTATTPSHSVPANVQNVLSMMKRHNDKLCSGALSKGLGSHSPHNMIHTSSGGIAAPSGGTGSDKSGSGSGSGKSREEPELAELLLQLQDEFARLSFEHAELTQQLHETRDARLRADLERECDVITARMEGKADQIAKLRRLQEKAEETNRRRRKKKKKRQAASGGGALSPTARAQSASASLRSGDQVEVRTTVRAHGSRTDVSSQMRRRPLSAGGGVTSGGTALGLLRDLRKIQTTLRHDDLTWDC